VREILGKAKTIRELLNGTKYAVDYYQREYKWGTKQIQELVDDLTSRFLQDYEPQHERQAVANYGHYFLGSIIISKKDSQSFIVDGQQRLTSLTLLLIYLNNLQRVRGRDYVPVNELICSTHYGQQSFNMNVGEWAACLEALFADQAFDETDKPESIQNIAQRYNDLKELLPDDVTNNALPYFIDWLTENVHLVEITAYSDDDAYTIFETMNDRGLPLSLPDMLKGYLLANITESKKRDEANTLWKKRVGELAEIGKDKDITPDFFKAWLRSQYAESIRERKKGAQAEDFDLIGSEFHRWVRKHEQALGLVGSSDFLRFVSRDFDFYARQYLRLMAASETVTQGLEHVYYNARLGFTTQYQLLLSPLVPTDSAEIIQQKLRLVGIYLDILLNRRLWNWHNIGFSTMQYAMFLVMREVRRKTPDELTEQLSQRLQTERESFMSNDRFALTQRNRDFVHLILARLTDYIECESGQASHFVEYVTGTRQKKYEVEHIWANKPGRYRDEFTRQDDFLGYRNHIGGLLLLPKSFNASYGALEYEDKLPHYYGQNLLAQSLHPQCYEHNPGFLKFIQRSGLPFKPHPEFRKQDMDERQDLFCQIAEQLWSPERLLEG
jgi:hypothetical protein